MANQDFAVSYKSKRKDFPKKWKDLNFENHKLRLFQEQIEGWVINVAKEIKDKRIGHADFAVLAILLSYFENIAKFKAGFTMFGNDSRSSYYFRKGLRQVFPKLKKGQKDKIHDLFYSQVRSGLYHVGLTGPKVELDCSINAPFIFKKKRLIICPGKMIPSIEKHFDNYCQDLRDPKNKTLRVNFEKRLKFVWGVKQ